LRRGKERTGGGTGRIGGGGDEIAGGVTVNRRERDRMLRRRGWGRMWWVEREGAVKRGKGGWKNSTRKGGISRGRQGEVRLGERGEGRQEK